MKPERLLILDILVYVSNKGTIQIREKGSGLCLTHFMCKMFLKAMGGKSAFDL
jgi:hypothetical protein